MLKPGSTLNKSGATLSPHHQTMRPKSPDGGRNSPDGGQGHHHRHWFTLFGKEKEDEVRALDEATHQALTLSQPAQGPFIDDLSSGSLWTVLAPGTIDRDDVRVLAQLLLDWVNDVLAPKRVVVKDLLEDFYDGQVLSDMADVLIEGGGKLLGGIALTEVARKKKLRVTLDLFNTALRLPPNEINWSVQSIMEKDVVATLRLLVALAERFAPHKRLPTGVCMEVIQVERTYNDGIKSHSVIKRITSGVAKANYSFDGYSYGHSEPAEEEDVFDKLFSEAPEKVDAVKVVLVKFANSHLACVNVKIKDMASDLRSGVVLVMLVQLLANYFVPLSDYYVNPVTDDDRLRNVGLVIILMDELGCLSSKTKEHILPDDVVSGDLKSTFRLLYSLFRKYKHAPVKKDASIV